NDEIALGMSGMGSKVAIGGMGRNDMKACSKVEGVRIAGICDVDSVNLGYAVDQCNQAGDKPDTFTDLRKLLDRRDIDAIWVTTPNHWHALAVIWACQAGKDVFVQKPASHSVFEGRKMVEASAKYDKVVCSTSLARSMNGFQEAVAYALAGNLGLPKFVHCVRFGPRNSIGKVTGETPIPATIDYDLWCGPAPKKPLYRKNLHYDWHWDWDYGNGELGNWGIHMLDGAAQAIGCSKSPEHVVSVGGRFGYEDDGQTPNTQIIFWDTKPIPVLYEMRALPRNRRSWKNGHWGIREMDQFHNLAYGVSVVCEGGYTLDNKVFDKNGKLIQTFTGSIPKYHQGFFDAVRRHDRKTLFAIDRVHPCTCLIHLGNISHQTGQPTPVAEIGNTIAKNRNLDFLWQRMLAHLDANGIDLKSTPPVLGASLAFDPDKECFIGDCSEKANRFLKPEGRERFVIPNEV
ncbi:MAG: Gfo/Idh/MocA family oxidoreductase, partial [Thermoguttaceae bacterium]|nr:Gfo/Idh/MocA family oxidoreductase [Thermoguttaceae bacterium]